MKGQPPPPPSDLSLLGNLSWQDVVGLKACLDNLPVSTDRARRPPMHHMVFTRSTYAHPCPTLL
jgi:hypothetical protein